MARILCMVKGLPENVLKTRGHLRISEVSKRRMGHVIDDYRYCRAFRIGFKQNVQRPPSE